MKFKTPIAYAKPDKEGHTLTEENLRTLVNNTELPVPILNDFNFASFPLGNCVGLKVENDELIADIEIKDYIPRKILKNSCYRVGYNVTTQEIITIGRIDKILDVYDKDDK